MSRQYVSVSFSPNDARRYTYCNDQAPLAVGDFYEVSTRRGLAKVRVEAIVDEAEALAAEQALGFATKHIAGPAQPPADLGEDEPC